MLVMMLALKEFYCIRELLFNSLFIKLVTVGCIELLQRSSTVTGKTGFRECNNINLHNHQLDVNIGHHWWACNEIGWFKILLL